MTDQTTNLVPIGIGYDTPLSKISDTDRMKHHVKQLQAAAFHQGLDGVRRYRQAHPEAANLQVNINALAYSAKPAGYDAALLAMAAKWLTDDDAVAESNRADVERLNARFGKDRFNPDNHFSKPLSAGRLAKFKALFLEHGVHLDTDRDGTPSKVKAAAKAARGRISIDRYVGPGLTVSGGKLAMGGESYAVSKNGNRECIRVRINGTVRRLYLDELGWIADRLIGNHGGEPDPSPTYSLRSIGECDYSAETDNLAPIGGDGPLECDYSPPSSPGDCDYSPPPVSLSDRIAALVAKQTPSPPAWDGTGEDPLNL